jgi:diguanylate cyclase (GGDEF)-like protein
MIGDGSTGALVVREIGRSKRERRRRVERRQTMASVPVERRTPGDRRVTLDRRSPSHATWEPVQVPAAVQDSPPFADRLRRLVHLELPEPEAERHWRAIVQHRRQLSEGVGRDVGEAVATLDYCLNVSPQLVEPTVIERAALADIEHRAMTDGLTGLFNRGFLDSVLAHEIARCRRHGAMMSVALVDLDGFKDANDRAGHGVGDAALQAVGDLIRRGLRATDIPCRYGGDEFAIVLPDTYRGGALLVGDRIVAAVRRHFSKLPLVGCGIALTVSVGVAWYGAACATKTTLLVAADRALYEAKAAGGDGVALAS